LAYDLSIIEISEVEERLYQNIYEVRGFIPELELHLSE
jgi:hypothetical protein